MFEPLNLLPFLSHKGTKAHRTGGSRHKVKKGKKRRFIMLYTFFVLY